MPRTVMPAEAWEALLALPSAPDALSKAWTLTHADRALIRTRIGGPSSALGLAARICALRACGRLILDHACAAWRRIVDQPWRIMTIGLREWAHGS